MMFKTLLPILTSAYVASALIIGDVTTFHFDKSHDVEPKQLTNAERLAAGLAPMAPGNLQSGGSGGAQRRASRIRSGAAPATSDKPIPIPPHPEQQDPIAITNPESTKTWLDDAVAEITLPFEVHIFDEQSDMIYVTTNGYLSFSNTAAYASQTLPASSVPAAAVFPFWDDLVTQAYPQGTFVDSTEDSLTVRWVTTYEYAEDGSVTYLDFTLYYETATPGIWYVYYDQVDAVEAASGPVYRMTIGAQGTPGSGLDVLFAYHSDTVRAGSRLAIDTVHGTVTADL